MPETTPPRRPLVFMTGPNLTGGGGQDIERDGDEAGSLSTPEAQRYERLASLGVGGMGRVDIARDGRLMRQVALKTARASTHDAAARLTQEALITAHLDHPNIVPLFDAGVTDEGDVFYTMRLVRGRSLEAALAECVDLKSRLGFVRHYLATCQAMAYAHSAGVVHRDLKPENVMIGDFGETQIVDWGVAKPLASEQGNAWRRDVLPDDVAVETQYHEVIGTPSYMAPEQAVPNAAPSIAADIFGLGAILYRLLTGHPPFRGASSTAELLGLVRRNVFEPLSTKSAEGFPPELVAICERAMLLDAKQRYKNAAALADDVAAWLDGRRVEAYAYSPWAYLKRVARQWRVPLTIAGIALVVLIVIATFAAVEIVSERDAARSAEEKAASNEALAESRLAEALIDQAEVHLGQGRSAEAELAAATAATLTPTADPRAIGVLMATTGSYGPSALHRTDLESRCARPTLTPSGSHVLCSDAKEVRVYARRGDGFVLLWKKTLTHSWATFGPFEREPAPADYVTIVDEDRRPLMLHLETGEPRALPPRDGADDRVHVGCHIATYGISETEATPVVIFAGWAVTVLDARGLAPLNKVCGGNHVEAAVVRGQELTAVCGDGTLFVYSIDPNGGLTEVSREDLQQDAGIDNIGDFGPGNVATLGPQGLVATITPRGRLQLRGAGHLRWRDTQVAGATTIAFSPDGKTIALQSIDGGVTFVSAALDDFGRVVAALPRGIARTLAWLPEGITTVGDKAIITWTLPPGGPRHIYGRDSEAGSDGLASLDIDGDQLVFGGGGGRLGFCSVSGGHCQEKRPIKSVVKRIRLYDGGKRYRVATSELHAVVDGDTKTGAHKLIVPSRPLRRLEPLIDGTWIGATWDVGPRIVPEADPPHTSWASSDPSPDIDVFDGRDTAFITENEWNLVLVEAHKDARTVAHVPGARAVALNAHMIAVAFPTEIVVFSRDGGELGRWDLEGLTPSDLDWFENNLFVGHVEGSIQVWSFDQGSGAQLLASMPGDRVAHEGRVGEVMARGDALWSAGWDGVVRRWSRTPLTTSADALLSSARARWAIKDGAP